MMQGWHLVDSSVWLEYFIDGPDAGCFAEPPFREGIEPMSER